MSDDDGAAADAAADGDAPAAYDDLLEEYARHATLGDVNGLLQWDQEVVMPEGGTPARSTQRSTLSALAHETLTDDVVGESLADLEGTDLHPARAAAVREIRREHERATAVPTDVVEELSAASSSALPKWQEAKEEDDFDAFAPALERLVDLSREYAAHVDPDRDPYAVLFEEYEPYLGVETADRVLTRLREELVTLIDAVGDSDVEQPRPFDVTVDEATQEALSRDVLSTLGYDFDRGRLDTAPHPFTSGTPFDARVTTRFSPEDLLDGLTSTVHEFGHACYVQGLPRDAYGSPLGESRDLTVHESQSRFWENHVARSRPFWDHAAPLVREHVPALDDLSPDAAYRAANRVYDDNLIRVDADELTYHMHVVVRYEIERDLIRGDLDVPEVPAVWDDKMEDYLGVRPETDAEGCLQDIHWSHGSFGYFPTYTLGSVLAAQLDAAMRDDVPDVDGKVRDGEFGPIREWHRDAVHRHGKRYRTDDLVERATGEPFSADAFLDYVREKYGDLYDLEGV